MMVQRFRNHETVERSFKRPLRQGKRAFSFCDHNKDDNHYYYCCSQSDADDNPFFMRMSGFNLRNG